MSGYDPSLYASTGSWAGMPYENSAYGAPPVGGYAMPGYMSTPSYGPAPQPPRGQPVYASFRPTGPAVPFSRPYEGPAPVDLYRSGGYLPPRGYGPPPMYEDPRMMMAGPPPGQPPPQKVFGVGVLFAERMDQMGLEVVVRDVYENTPAAATGQLNVGDVLKSVDGRNVQGQSIRELRSCLPGPLGTVVNLGFDGEQGPYDVDLERVQSRRGGNTIFGGSSSGFAPPTAQREAPPPPQTTEGKAYVGFSVQAVGDPRGPPEFVVANVTADSTADQKGLQQGDKIQTIDGNEVAGMHEEEVKQMLIGEPFSVITIVTASKSVEIERDCAVPEPEAGGPIVGNMPSQYAMGGYYGSMPPPYGGGFQSHAVPMPMAMPTQYAPSPPRGYGMMAPQPRTFPTGYSPSVGYQPAPTPATTYAPGPSYSYAAPPSYPPPRFGGAPNYGAPASYPGPPPNYGPPGYGPPSYGPPTGYGGAPASYGTPSYGPPTNYGAAPAGYGSYEPASYGSYGPPPMPGRPVPVP